MNIASLVIYGSCARGDNVSSSDVDLFSITSAGDYRMIVQNKINLALYPRSTAFEMAKTGELFMLHLVREGRALIDFDGDFEKLKADFNFKNSYSKEIENATKLGWALVAIGKNVKNYALVNKRIAWCVRTILIAKAAEQQEALFSTNALTEFAGDAIVKILIENKNTSVNNQKIYKPFQIFLRTWGSSHKATEQMSLIEYAELFERTGNVVGLKTIQAFHDDLAFGGY